jgi:cell division protease FtsH
MDKSDSAKKNIIDKSPTWLRLLLFFVLWILISIGYASYMVDKQIEDIAYSEFKQKVAAGEVASIEVKGPKITGQYAQAEEEAPDKEAASEKKAAPDKKETPEKTEAADQPPPQPEVFSTVMPTFEDPELMPLLKKTR